MAEGTVETSKVVRRRIIERPRLTRLLDESPARIKMLIAPAGYGKTTLARQWLGADRRCAIAQCATATPDIAAVIERVVVPGAVATGATVDRLLERLRVSASPRDDLEVFLDLALELLQPWPADLWLLLDDYHELMPSADVESFVETLIARSEINVVITSRRRPTWATARGILYGDFVEIATRELAMTTTEVAEVLGSPARVPESVRAVRGWPAFVALAGSRDNLDIPEPAADDALLAFLANEVYVQASERTRSALSEIAFAPYRHGFLLRKLHAPEVASEIEQEGFRVGLLSENADGEAAIHPLLQQFLQQESATSRSTARDRAVERLWEVYVDEHAWDEAFTLIARSRRPDLFIDLLECALRPLLDSGRLETLRRWIDYGSTLGAEHPLMKLADAELALRAGLLLRAEALGGEAADGFARSNEWAARALYVAGQAAHLQGREDDALRHFATAESRVMSESLRRAIQWSRLVCMVDLELPEALDIVIGIERDKCIEAEDFVRRSSARLLYELRMDRLSSLDGARAAAQVVDLVSDSTRRAGFWSTYGGALAVAAEYDLAFWVADRFLKDLAAGRIGFAFPYAFALLAMSHLGRREFDEADEALSRADTAAEGLHDLHAMANVRAIRGRLLLSVGHLDEALDELRPMGSGSAMTRGMIGELFACRALALARAGDSAYAELAETAREMTRALEPRVAAPMAHAIFASVTNAADTVELVRHATDEAIDTGSWDCYVSAYRSHPECLLALIGDEGRLPFVLDVMKRASDGPLAAQLGLVFTQRGTGTLTPRETEIHGLVALGMTNREIAQRLVISEATVKLHVHHIFQKLNVRTRTAAAAVYRSDSGQSQ